MADQDQSKFLEALALRVLDTQNCPEDHKQSLQTAQEALLDLRSAAEEQPEP